MQAMLVALLVAVVPATLGTTASPVDKVLTMLSDLHGHIVDDGKVVQKEYEEFAEWCEDRSRNLGFEIKTGKASVKRLQAKISENAATINSLQMKVEELAADISKDEADLKAATDIRNKEAKDFAAEEKGLLSTLDMLERATGILEKEMQGGSSMVQLQGAGNLAQALNVMVQASLIGSSDASTLSAFVQSAQKAEEEEDDEDNGAPSASTYKKQSGAVVDTLEDLTEKAETQLADLRKKESTALFNYESLKQALQDQIKFGEKGMEDAKKSKASSSEAKSRAEGDLGVTSKELKEDTKAKSILHHDCMTKAEAFEAEVKSRGEEIKAITAAMKFIQDSIGDSSTSFLQVARSRLGGVEPATHAEVLHCIRDLAHSQHSRALMQLASQIGRGGPFQKIKGLISDMISKLEDEAGEDAAKKAYCDRELKDAKAKKEDKLDDIAQLSTRIEQMGAKSAMLKQDVATLESQLSKLLKSQAQMDRLRLKEKAEYENAKADLEKGLNGVKMALNVLTDYYAKGNSAHSSSDGAASTIIGLLEVVEADITKELAEITADEEAAVAEYERVTSENEIERAQKSQDVKYKTQESKELDKATAEQTSDRTSVKAELSAVIAYLDRLKQQCIAKPEKYEERKMHRETEIRGLKEALDILESEVALVQQHVVHRTLRGGRGRTAAL